MSAQRNFAAVATLSVLACLAVGVNADDVADFAAPLKVEYERPGADLSNYDAVLLADLDVSDAKILPPPWLADKAFNWEVSDENVARLQADYVAAMKSQIQGNAGYPIASEPGARVVVLAVRIISFMPYAERDDKATTRGSGEMRIQAELRDAQTSELLALYEGPQEVGKDYQPNTDVSKEQNLKKLFDSWGRRVRLAMDAAHGRT
jgi:hypothetical protein